MDYSIIVVNLIIIVILLAGIGLTCFALPGNLLIFLTALGYGFFDRFLHFDYTFLALLFGALLLGEVVEFAASALGAKKENASTRAVVAAFAGAVLGGILGSAIFPFIGTIVGAILLSFGLSYWAEYTKTGDAAKSAKVAKSVAVGLIVGTIFKITVAVGMVIAVIGRLPWT